MADRMSDYQRSAILSASPAQLLTMLYDRLLLDLHRAEQAQAAERWAEASAQLRHAQDIIIELQRTLDVDAWDGAGRLMAIYDYVFEAAMQANIGRDIELTRECQRRLEPLRQAWHEAAAMPAGVPVGAAAGVDRVG
jgi:flagellar protein FliS